MVIRLLSVPDQLEVSGLHQTIQAVLGWEDDPSYIVRIHGQEFNDFRRQTRTKKLADFRLHRQEKFYYASDLMSLWEWDIRVPSISRMEHPAMCPYVWAGVVRLHRNTAAVRLDRPSLASRTKVLNQELDQVSKRWSPGSALWRRDPRLLDALRGGR
jgi:Plasmid pRiA4b ORF-3-like protein